MAALRLLVFFKGLELFILIDSLVHKQSTSSILNALGTNRSLEVGLQHIAACHVQL